MVGTAYVIEQLGRALQQSELVIADLQQQLAEAKADVEAARTGS